ncbi:response regulator transcription factor [Noviherbaspirillum sp. 1P10PC]|uniref:response regulator transcription factor n=1 Tax=Noviherbaspirillum sp. 1P10PC TaxID=3132292 RepID=UPI0039A0D225
MNLIATACPELRARCNQGVQAYGPVLTTASYESVAHLIVRLQLNIIFIDIALPGFDGPADLLELHRLNVTAKIIVLGSDVPEEMELRMFLAGARGICNIDSDIDKIAGAFAAVDCGQLWLRRSLVSRLLDGMRVNTPPDPGAKALSLRSLLALTPREREIATLVGRGKSNKQIANSLAITERTVKAHLSEIFRKLSIGDRLTLALRVIEQRESSKPLVEKNAA